MSSYAVFYIECDECGQEFTAEDVDDLDEAEEVYEREYNHRNVEVINTNGSTNYIDHMCESCFDMLLYCERCATTVYRDDGWFCDEGLCQECAGEAHEEWAAEDPATFVDNECTNCGFMVEGPLKDHYTKCLVKL